MVSERIKDLRERDGYSQTALSKKLGLTRSSINAWETGISVPSTTFDTIFGRVISFIQSINRLYIRYGHIRKPAHRQSHH